MKTKFLLIAGTFLFTLVAHAFPNKGDASIIAGTHVSGKQSFKIQLKNTLVEHKSANNTFLSRSELFVNGQLVETTNTWEMADDMMSESDIENILVLCTSLGGVNEKLKVTAGSFDTCKMPADSEEIKRGFGAFSQQDTGFVWLGKVPFGVVKIDTKNAQEKSTTKLQLNSFKRGAK